MGKVVAQDGRGWNQSEAGVAHGNMGRGLAMGKTS